MHATWIAVLSQFKKVFSQEFGGYLFNAGNTFNFGVFLKKSQFCIVELDRARA